jgi:lipoate-protein ligase A
MHSQRRILPSLPEPLRKNDALFLYGACQPLPYVQTYIEDRAQVVHGPACKPAREVRLAECEADGVCVRARRGGGGTVVLGPGIVVIVVVGKRLGDEPATDIFERIHHALSAIIVDATGVRLDPRGISDLAVDERKVLGSSLYLARGRGLYFYQSSLLVDCDTALFERYLHDPPRQPKYRLGRTHGQFCTCLRECGVAYDAPALSGLIAASLPGRLRAVESSPNLSSGKARV